MEQMRAVVLRQRGVAGLAEELRPVPRPGDGEVLVRVRACGIGGTILNKVNQLSDAELPRIPGHEFAGEVVETGPGVSWPAAGDRVMAYYYVTCGRCRHCWQGAPARCLNHGRGQDRIGQSRDGAYAEYVCVPDRNLLAVPDGLGMIEATVAIDALATPLHVCRRADVQPGERVAVVGAAGGVGIHLLQLAALRAARVIGIDRQHKLDAIRPYAPEAELLAAERPWGEDLAESVDVVVDFIGTPASRDQALAALAPGGRLVVLTVEPGSIVSAASARIVSHELSILGSKYATHAELATAAELLLDGRVRPVITTRGDLGTVASQLAAIERGEVVGRGVLDLTG